jgi:hypothetical protein
MEIYAKSKLNQNIYDKVRKGASAIEIHLDDDFMEANDYWDEKIVNEVPIVAVHTPLIKGDDANIEIFKNRKTLIKTCNFARRIAETQNHSVMIICHLGTDPYLLKSLGAYDSLVFFMRDLVNTYECLTFAVENVTPFSTGDQNNLAFRTVAYDSYPRFVKDVGHERVGTCLDTCHAMMTERLLTNVSNYLCHDAETFGNNTLNCDMEAFFKANQDTIKWIHLSNSKSHGLYEDHGRPFEKEDADDLRKIMQLYKKYCYSCPITVEVREQDYADAVNYMTTCETLALVLQSLDQ